MKLQHLRVFTAVVESGSFVTAAKRMRVSQPAISTAIRSLEEELGEPLFERPGGGRRVIPTAKALRFKQHVADILERCEVARTEFRSRLDKPPRLRLGILNTIDSAHVANAATMVRNLLPGWHLQLWEGDPARLAGWLRQKRIDAAWTVVDANVSTARVLWREPFVALVARGHRLAQRRRTPIVLKELADELLVLRLSCELTGGQLRDAGVRMRIAARALRDEVALRLVARGLGIAIAPRSLATRDMVDVAITDLDLHRSIGLRWRADLPTATVTALLDAVRSSHREGGLAT